MLDIKYIREHVDKTKVGLERKGFNPSLVDELLEVDSRRRSALSQLEERRAKQKKIDYTDQEELIKAKELKVDIDLLEKQLASLDTDYQSILLSIPNLPFDDVPIGEAESANQVVRTVGEKPTLVNPLDHVALGARYDLFDTERASKASGARFNYLKNQAVLLELALVRYAFDAALKYAYVPMIVPELVNHATVMGTGYLPHGADEVYKTQDDLYLIGTSELALVAYHKDEILGSLPVRYAAFSSCFRREAGSYGKDTAGIFRQHQFDKVELVSFVKPEDSPAEHERILHIEEELMQSLGLPYQVVEIGSGDLGIQAAKKYDIEAWLPGQEKYRETHSCSNTSDFQSRRLNIRYKTAEGSNEFVHTLNGTAVAVGRMLIAILENGQQADGSITIPSALIPYCGFSSISA